MILDYNKVLEDGDQPADGEQQADGQEAGRGGLSSERGQPDQETGAGEVRRGGCSSP